MGPHTKLTIIREFEVQHVVRQKSTRLPSAVQTGAIPPLSFSCGIQAAAAACLISAHPVEPHTSFLSFGVRRAACGAWQKWNENLSSYYILLATWRLWSHFLLFVQYKFWVIEILAFLGMVIINNLLLNMTQMSNEFIKNINI